MKALVQTRYGIDAITLEDRPEPTAGEGEVRVRITSASLNPADWHKATGTPAFLRLTEGLRRPKHEIIGTDAAGVVDQVGASVTEFAVGDRVFGSFPGAYAEAAVAKPDRLARTPDNMTDADASGLPIAGVTALQAVERGNVAGRRVLVSGASGGVGTYAVQIARALGAGHITGVCSGRNAELVRSLGCDEVIDYTTDDYTELGRAEPYDVLIDLAGTRRFGDVRRCLSPDATWLMVGPDSKDGVLGPLPQMIGLITRARFARVDLQAFVAEETAERLEKLAELVAQDELRTVVDRTFALDKAIEAYDYLGIRRARGKVLFEIV